MQWLPMEEKSSNRSGQTRPKLLQDFVIQLVMSLVFISILLPFEHTRAFREL